MKKKVHVFMLYFLAWLLLPVTGFAQTGSNHHKSKNPYRSNYQRMTAGKNSVSYEIRGGELWSCGSNTNGLLGNNSTLGSTTANPVRIGTDNNWISIAAGGRFTVGMKSDGTLWAWGKNDHWQLGNNSGPDQSAPIQVGNDNNWASVACGQDHTLALKSDGSLWAWGYNLSGPLGTGNTTDRPTPTQIGTDTRWMSIACGEEHSIALKSDGSLWTWGWNVNGQLGDNSTISKFTPTRIGSDKDWAGIASKGNFTVALKSNGSLWTWGQNSDGQLGDGTIVQKNVPTRIGTDNNWVSIDCGTYHTVALKSDGSVWAWGENFDGQLGDGTTVQKNIPTRAGTDNDWVSIACGSYFTMGIKSDGTFWGWGYNDLGQLGDGTSTDKNIPTKVRKSNRDWLQVANGSIHTIALKGDGTLWAWGYNDFGQLGDGAITSKSTPIQVGNNNKWASMACGFYYSVGLQSNGTLWAWGNNQFGQLGDNTIIHKNTPTQVGTDNQWVNIACGSNFTLGLKSNGTLYGWGRNDLGQLGDNTQIDKHVPTQIGSDNKWVSIACGQGHSIGLKSNGTLWTWGSNSYGQLGDGTTIDKIVPTQIGTDTTWVSIASGIYHTLALKSNGTLWTWGQNTAGQLGNNTTIDNPTPAQVGTDTKWISIGSGGYNCIATKSDGALWAWGWNDYGQLGDGTTTQRNTPTQINSQSDIVSIGSGALPNHSAVIKADRSSICLTGRNQFGQLGSGNTINSSTYSCNNWACRTYSLFAGSQAIAQQPLGGLGNRTDFQGNCALGLSITPSTPAPVSGTVTAQIFIDATVQNNNGTRYVQRHYDILPATNPNTATATITLYFLQSEFNAFNTAVGAGLKLPAGPNDAAGKANLKVTQLHGTPTGGYAPGNYPTTWGGVGPARLVIDPVDANIVWNSDDNRWEVTFDITGFSGFFVGTQAVTPLPVKLLSFTAQEANAHTNHIDWITAAEDAGTTFHITRGNNGITFETIGTVIGKNGNNSYTFMDEHPLDGTNYYRLIIEEASGNSNYSNIAAVRRAAGGGSVMVSPVPSSSFINITNSAPGLTGTEVNIVDIQGRSIQSFTLANMQRIDISNWASGLYMLKLADGSVLRVVKQ